MKKNAFIKALKILAGVVVFLSSVFIPAGTLVWPEAWILLLGYFVAMNLLGYWLKKHDPGLYKERAATRSAGKTWDKALLTVYTVLLLSMFVICGLDAVRFRWSHAPLAVRIAGFAGLIPVSVIIVKVFKVNTFASEVVRIQQDRAHRVIKEGPYRIVRHPMYTAIILFMFCLPLALGSFWGLVFSGLNTVLYIIRTYAEDRTLQKELPGYPEYVQETPFRLLPGIW